MGFCNISLQEHILFLPKLLKCRENPQLPNSTSQKCHWSVLTERNCSKPKPLGVHFPATWPWSNGSGRSGAISCSSPRRGTLSSSTASGTISTTFWRHRGCNRSGLRTCRGVLERVGCKTLHRKSARRLSRGRLIKTATTILASRSRQGSVDHLKCSCVLRPALKILVHSVIWVLSRAGCLDSRSRRRMMKKQLAKSSSLEIAKCKCQTRDLSTKCFYGFGLDLGAYNVLEIVAANILASWKSSEIICNLLGVSFQQNSRASLRGKNAQYTSSFR